MEQLLCGTWLIVYWPHSPSYSQRGQDLLSYHVPKKRVTDQVQFAASVTPPRLPESRAGLTKRETASFMLAAFWVFILYPSVE